MARDLAKEAGALEQAANKIREYADQLDAQKRQAVTQVQTTTWLGATALAAQRVAGDIETSLNKHITNMRVVADKVAQDPILQHKHVYLNVPFFVGRTVIYFAGWMFLSWFFSRWSQKEDREGGAIAHRKMAALAGPGILFWGFSITFMPRDVTSSIAARVCSMVSLRCATRPIVLAVRSAM